MSALHLSFMLSAGLGISALVVHARPEDAPATGPAELQTPVTGPLTYYQASCARCHSNYGAGYTVHLRELSDERLATAVDDMAHGPAQAPLEGKPLEDQVNLHRALAKGMPFVWLAPHVGDTPVHGEVLPDSKVTIELDGKPTEAKVDGHSFTLDTTGKKVGAIVVKWKDKETTMKP